MFVTMSHVGVSFHRWGQSHDALVDVDLLIPAGQWIMVTGHNGSGKSTLLKILAGQIEPTDGVIEFARFGPDDVGRSFRSEVFHVRQDPLLGTADALTLMENLLVAVPSAELNRRSRVERREHLVQLMARVGMLSRAHQLLRDFSGGERQQVAMLIALIRKPRLLLLDEPFSALDPARAAEALPLIGELSTGGTTVVQVTHDVATATSLGHRTLVLDKGRLVGDLLGSARQCH